jgi:small subunit ribosomal protein S8
MITDPIADMLTRVRNAAQAKVKRVDMPVSKLKTEFARILKENHFIQDYKVWMMAGLGCCVFTCATSKTSR